MEQEYSPSAALSLDPEGPKVLFRISSLGPYEPAIGPGGTNSRTAEMVGSVKRSPWGNSSWGGSGCIGFPLIRRLGRERAHLLARRGQISAPPPLLRWYRRPRSCV